MPKLDSIVLFGFKLSPHRRIPEDRNPSGSVCQIHGTDVTLDSVTTIVFDHETLQNQEPWLRNVTTNLTHLILSHAGSPSIESSLAKVLKKKIRQIDSDQSSSSWQHLVDSSYVYFCNVQEIYLYYDLSRSYYMNASDEI